MLDFALAVIFLAFHTIITSHAIGAIGLDRERLGLEFLWCLGLFNRDKNDFFNFFTLNAFPVFLLLKAFVKVMITSGICPFWVPENQKFIKQT